MPCYGCCFHPGCVYNVTDTLWSGGNKFHKGGESIPLADHLKQEPYNRTVYPQCFFPLYEAVDCFSS